MTPPIARAAVLAGIVLAAVGCVADEAFRASLLLTVPETGTPGGAIQVEVVTERADAATAVNGVLTEVVHARFGGTGTFPAQVTVESEAEKDRLRLRIWRDDDGEEDLDPCEPGGIQALEWPDEAGYVPVWVSTSALVPRGAAPADPTPCDLDHDGFADDLDCDDTDPGIHPGVAEICDGRDQDCDGAVDEEAVDVALHFLDADGDGHGAAEGPVQRLCGPIPGWVRDVRDDCDDHDPAVYPGAEEVCDGRDQDCNHFVDESAVDAPTWYRDQDGDGYGDPDEAVAACEAPPGRVAPGGDCDDDDPGISPGAAEVCDGVDQDCDGVPDDGFPVSAWYRDSDGDQWGRIATPFEACYEPAGYRPTTGDCDDGDGGIHPESEEVCDAVDQDCDGMLDNGLPVSEWYADADEDGYGDPAGPVSACAAPPGRVGEAGDCDDADPGVHPGAPEACDGVDHDCDGEADEPESRDARTWRRDGDGDGWGVAGDALVSCAAPAGFVEPSGDCDDADPAVHPGAAEVVPDGVDQDCDGRVDVVPCLASASPLPLADGAVGVGGIAGGALAVAPDLTGDGLPELVFGDPVAESARGEVVVHSGLLEGGDVADVGAGYDLRVLGAHAYAGLGARIAGGSDLDGDGRPDLVVAASGDWALGDGTSAEVPFVVLFAPFEATGGSASLGSPSGPAYAVLDGSDGGWSSTASFGWPYAVADFDGDGHGDLLVGDPRAGDLGPGAGAVHVVFGPLAPGEYAVSGEAPDLRVQRLPGPFPGTGMGRGLAAAGDADLDGTTDVAAGAGMGAFLLCGRAEGGPFPGPPAALEWGEHVALGVDAGDLDGDGAPDVVAWDRSGVALWRGVACGEGRAAPDAVSLFPFDGTDPLEGVAGVAVADLDGDGLDDLVVGTEEWDGGVVAEVTVWFGAPSLPETLHPDAAGLRSVQEGIARPSPLAGDLDGDGLPELGIRILDGGWAGWPFSTGEGLVVHAFDRSSCGGAP
ncbi:FG-GAP-like repeat-containing protein [Myxococcota bacterium]|nr:FG-GAP-like repeat-containing protein [Myxococcota bacterium]